MPIADTMAVATSAPCTRRTIQPAAAPQLRPTAHSPAGPLPTSEASFTKSPIVSGYGGISLLLALLAAASSGSTLPSMSSYSYVSAAPSKAAAVASSSAAERRRSRRIVAPRQSCAAASGGVLEKTVQSA